MKKLNNSVLLLILVILIGVFVLSRLFRSPGRERSLKATVVTVDTAKITEVHVYPAEAPGQHLRLAPDQGVWQVWQDQRHEAAEPALIKNAFGSLEAIRTERMVARKENKWHEYNVDTAGTHVVVMGEGETLANLWIGKSQSGSIYVRNDDEDDVYAVRGMLSNYFNKGFNGWRDKSFASLTPDTVTRITFQYPADSGFTAVKTDTLWTVDGAIIPMSKIQPYLSKLRNKNMTDFVEQFTPASAADVTVTFARGDAALLTLHAWKQAADAWVLESSQRAGVYFEDENGRTAKEFFPAKASWLPQ